MKGKDYVVIEKPTFVSLGLIDYVNENIYHSDIVSLDQYDNGYEIELIGLCTDICVVSNALLLKASFYETPITVDASACAGVSSELIKLHFPL